jgi:hypothetical protein
VDLLKVKSTRGVAFADYDNDGDIDALAINMHDRPSLYRNEGESRNHWISFDSKEHAVIVTPSGHGSKSCQVDERTQQRSVAGAATFPIMTCAFISGSVGQAASRPSGSDGLEDTSKS